MRLFQNQRIWVVHLVSLTRLVAILLFAGLTSNGHHYPIFFMWLYSFAMISDLLDGYLSRRLKVETYFGKVLDLVADKSLTTVTLLYAATCGIDLFPLALIAVRDIVMLGMRLVVVNGLQLLPTNRIFGGIMATWLWGSTLILIHLSATGNTISSINSAYWLCSMVFTANFVIRVYVSAPKIQVVATERKI